MAASSFVGVGKISETTLTGALIVPGEWLPSNYKPDYPLRHSLAQLSYEIWATLLDKQGHQQDRLLRVAAAMFDEFDREMVAWDEADKQKKADDVSKSRNNGYPIPDHWKWASDLGNYHLFLEFSEDDYPTVVSSVTTGPSLVWGDLYALCALRLIDEAVSLLNGGHIGEGGACAVQVALLWKTAMLCYHGEDDFQAVATAFAHRGADESHRENRRVRSMAIDEYKSRTWPTRAAAARALAKKFNRVELVVLRWIRHYERQVGDGTIPAA